MQDIRGVGSIPGLERPPGGGHGNPLQCSCLEKPMDRGAWRAAVHGVARSRTWLERRSMQHAKHTRGFLLETWSPETRIQMTAVPSAWAGQVLLFPVHQLCFPSGGSQGPSEGTVTRHGARIWHSQALALATSPFLFRVAPTETKHKLNRLS